jgi:hypothetical protein
MKTCMPSILFILLLLTLACEKASYNYSADQSISPGTGGSLARFTISGNYMYTVNGSTLNTFDITNEKNPIQVAEIYVNIGVETIFAMDDLLFLGTRSGVYIYSILNPASPEYISLYSHVQSCDPVVVKGNYAYSTLNTSGPCSNGVNELDVIDISNPTNPHEIKTLPMENPKGLGISGSLLFVCDEGLKVYDLTHPTNPSFLKKIDVDAIDVIPIDTLLLVATEQGLAEYSINAENEIHYISTLY